MLAVTTPPADARIRAYAFCSTRNAAATLVLVNLASEPLCVAPPGLANLQTPRLEFITTPADGTVTSAGALLNGVPLALTPAGALPAMPGVSVAPSLPITLPPLSVAFVQFDTDADACMGVAVSEDE